MIILTEPSPKAVELFDGFQRDGFDRPFLPLHSCAPKSIIPNDIRERPHYQPVTIEDEIQWFTVSIARRELDADDFQVAVATSRAIIVTAGKRRERFAGPVVGIFNEGRDGDPSFR